VYGDPDPSVHPQPESYWGNVNPIGIRSCYDEGKRAAETLFMDYHRQNGVDIRIARIFNTYGPRMCPDDGRVVSNFIVQALQGKDITVYGEGQQTRSFCYCDDLIDGFVSLMNQEAVIGPMNIGNRKPVASQRSSMRHCLKMTRSNVSLTLLRRRRYSVGSRRSL
jgi:UDP-glucuronate decarboxylase